MTTQYGLTPTGFVTKQQQDIISELQSSLQIGLGTNINLLPQAVFGQLVAIFSEREALVWQLAEAVYSSQYPSGAEGTSVDNILALNNLRRLGPKPTKTAPTATNGTPGLVAYGAPGTVIPAGSIISVLGNPGLQFTTDANATIGASVDAVQLISLYGGAPSQGTFTLQITDPAGNILTTPPIPWNAAATTTSIAWPVAPSSGAFVIAVNELLTAPIPFNATQAQVQTAIRALAGYSTINSTGSPTAGPVVIDWNGLSQPVVSINATKIVFSANPTAGTFQISLNGTNAAAVAFDGTAANLQTAIRDIAGFERVTVSGAATLASGFYLDWGWTTPAVVAIVANPTGATLSVAQTYSLSQAATLVNSVQSAINTLFDRELLNYPYTDVTVSGALATALLTVTFGAGALVVGQPPSGDRPQKVFEVPFNSLQNGTVVINVNAATSVVGAPSEVVLAATCTVNGPNFVATGYLSVIGSPVSGWTSVNNPLDCIAGANTETDLAALQRRATLLSAQANGPLQSIADQVQRVPNVVQAIGFENTSLAAQQLVTFDAAPSAGSFTLAFTGPAGGVETTAAIPWNAQANAQTVNFSGIPPSGSWSLTFGLLTTASIAFNATSTSVQAAVRALAGYAHAIVSGSYLLGFTIVNGQNKQDTVVANNSLGGGVVITTVPSVQSRINDLTSYGPVLVSGSFGAGFLVSFNGSAGGQPQLLMVAANSLTGVSFITVAFGRPGKSFEIVVNDNNGQASNTAIAQAIFNSKPAGINSYGTTTLPVADAFGNVFNVSFSKPTQVAIYMVVTLQTDLTTSPQPQFNPASITTIQKDLVEIGNAFPAGGTIIGFGSGGLIGAFNAVPGITNYTLYFGTSPNPTQNQNIQLLPEQVALMETFNIIVSYV